MQYIAISHIHLDHGGGAATLVKYLPNAKIVVHPKGASHLANPAKLWQQSQAVLGRTITDLYGPPESAPPNQILPTPDGTVLDLGQGRTIKTVETIGHASHHQSYQDTATKAIFPGDAAGIYLKEIDTIVPTTPSPFYMDVALVSIDRLLNLRPTALYYSHFGQGQNPTTKLQTYKAQLKLWAGIAQTGIQNGQNEETITEQILKNDPASKRAQQYLQRNQILAKTMLNQSVQGIVEYVQKALAKQL